MTQEQPPALLHSRALESQCVIAVTLIVTSVSASRSGKDSAHRILCRMAGKYLYIVMFKNMAQCVILKDSPPSSLPRYIFSDLKFRNSCFPWMFPFFLSWKFCNLGFPLCLEAEN